MSPHKLPPLTTAIISQILGIFLLLVLTQTVMAQSPGQNNNESEDYPVPAGEPDMLFYLQRSLDLHSVIYKAKYVAEKNGRRKPAINNPIEIYWLLHDKMGSKKPLSKVQQLGYGVRTEVIDDDIIEVKLVAYKDLPIQLKPAKKENKYNAHVFLGGQDLILNKVFINIDGGTKLKPNVTYIEITGINVGNGKKRVHRIVP